MISQYPHTQLLGELIPHAWHHCKEGIECWDENLRHWRADSPFQIALWKNEYIRCTGCYKHWRQQLPSSLLPAQKVRFLNPNKWSSSSFTRMPGSRASSPSTLNSTNTPPGSTMSCAGNCKTSYQTNFSWIPAGNQLGLNAQWLTLMPTFPCKLLLLQVRWLILLYNTRYMFKCSWL